MKKPHPSFYFVILGALVTLQQSMDSTTLADYARDFLVGVVVNLVGELVFVRWLKIDKKGPIPLFASPLIWVGIPALFALGYVFFFTNL